MTPTPSASVIDIDDRRLFHLYLAGEFDPLSAEFLRVFQHFAGTVYMSVSKADRASLLRFLKIFLTLFTQPDYIIPERFVLPFVQQNPLLSTLVAMTPFRNTDGFLELLHHQPSNFVKILTLYSARNTLRFNRRKLFEVNPDLASFWYNQFCGLYTCGLVRDDVVQHLKEHLAYRDERMKLALAICEPYYGSTYVDGTIDREVKPFLNEVVRRSLRFVQCHNQPNPKKIAVISDLWFPEHSSYRICASYVKELKKSFHLTFFHVDEDRARLDLSLFDEVHRLEFDRGALRVERLLSNDFAAVYFPDVGMTTPSIMLANHRIAPVQFCSPGHSVSTWGAEIDYFISGQDVEIPDAPERHYSERLVLLPGMGAIHNRPRYQLTGAKKTVPEIVINCPWSVQKINAPFCRTLRKLLDRAEKPVRLRFFAAGSGRYNAYLPFLADVREFLGEKALLDSVPFLPYAEYMRRMEEADFSLDSFHFAGCNTIADSLFLRKPTVVWEGDRWYNRIGPAMLRLVGQGEFICQNEDEFLDRALLLIHDDLRRDEVAGELRAADLDATVFSTAAAPSFRRAVEYLIANHEQLKQEGSRKPIVIR